MTGQDEVDNWSDEEDDEEELFSGEFGEEEELFSGEFGEDDGGDDELKVDLFEVVFSTEFRPTEDIVVDNLFIHESEGYVLEEFNNWDKLRRE